MKIEPQRALLEKERGDEKKTKKVALAKARDMAQWKKTLIDAIEQF